MVGTVLFIIRALKFERLKSKEKEDCSAPADDIEDVCAHGVEATDDVGL